VDLAGHCCSPGQRWEHDECTGRPTTCGPGERIERATGHCTPAPCPAGATRDGDQRRCCAAGRAWNARAGRCDGDPEPCPDDQRDCSPRSGPDTPVPHGSQPAGAMGIPGGMFRMGSDERRVHLEPFWIDRTEVTLGAYRRCVRAGVCDAANDAFVSHPADTLPQTNATHAMARRYCAWAGGRLPTEAEWELAARGYDGRTQPWGARRADCALARVLGCGTGAATVGSAPAGASPFGAMDMVGNVAEWTLDRSGPLPDEGVDYDPIGPARGRTRVVRGGSHGDAPGDATATARRAVRDDEARFDVGWRCVYTAR